MISVCQASPREELHPRQGQHSIRRPIAESATNPASAGRTSRSGPKCQSTSRSWSFSARRKVAYQTGTAVDLDNVSAMRHRIGQTCVAVVATGKVAEGLSRGPIVHSRCWNRSPGKWISGNGLIHAVHAHRVMRRSSPECVAVGKIGRRCTRHCPRPPASAGHSSSGAR